ncbi:hypothetical protein B0H14DRAFT_2635642 [Mycena olivaceomarginata]|nr:hypothetical protein B0H14DRAFT_2635642 [Mycena olivaceomarginata]
MFAQCPWPTRGPKVTSYAIHTPKAANVEVFKTAAKLTGIFFLWIANIVAMAPQLAHPTLHSHNHTIQNRGREGDLLVHVPRAAVGTLPICTSSIEGPERSGVQPSPKTAVANPWPEKHILTICAAGPGKRENLVDVAVDPMRHGITKFSETEPWGISRQSCVYRKTQLLEQTWSQPPNLAADHIDQNAGVLFWDFTFSSIQLIWLSWVTK